MKYKKISLVLLKDFTLFLIALVIGYFALLIYLFSLSLPMQSAQKPELLAFALTLLVIIYSELIFVLNLWKVCISKRVQSLIGNPNQLLNSESTPIKSLLFDFVKLLLIALILSIFSMFVFDGIYEYLVINQPIESFGVLLLTIILLTLVFIITIVVGLLYLGLKIKS